MNLREVTIGRSPNCDIYLDQRCQYASSVHGTIYYDGNQLMFRDASSNGTMINNISVKKRAVPIHRGDSIMIAGKYPINWNQIDSFFPYASPSSMGTTVEVSSFMLQQASNAEPLNLSEWSWGAFVLYWIWGFFNGCWWMFLVKMGIFFLGVLLCWIPFGTIFISIVDLGISVLFGVKGTEWAWNNRSWNSISHFRQTQDTWNKVGLALFLFGIVIIVITVMTIPFFFAAIF